MIVITPSSASTFEFGSISLTELLAAAICFSVSPFH